LSQVATAARDPGRLASFGVGVAVLLSLLLSLLLSPVEAAPPIPEDLLRQLQVQPSSPSTVQESAPIGGFLEGAVDPDAYVVGPGDRFRIEAAGPTNFTLTPTVDPEGWVSLGEYGSVEIGGLTLSQSRQKIRTVLAEVLRKTPVQVRLWDLRRFKVYVLGAVHQPGAYPATAVTRASEAVALAGGVADSASLRTIRILRRDQSVPLTVDLAAFRLAGDLDSNPFLADGDRIVVPVRAQTFSVTGAVEHPGTWDLREGDTLAGVLGWIGVRPDADTTRALLARFRAGGPGDVFDTLSVPLGPAAGGENPMALMNGDRLFVRPLPRFHQADAVLVRGEVRHPGRVPILVGTTRLRDAIDGAGGLLAGALASRVTLIRSALPDSAVPVTRPGALPASFSYDRPEAGRQHLGLSPDASRTTLDLAGGDNPLLLDGDRIVVPRATGFVRVTGLVARPGLYPREAGWDYADYLQAAGGTVKDADRSRTRLVRGGEGSSTDASRADSIEDGDILFVPQKPALTRSRWELVRDVLGVAAQVATIVLVINQASK
jgi:protein involved in polysaccharide export with SLBB domain